MKPCSTPQQLERFLLNQLEGSESEAVEAHIEECDRCQHLLEQMTIGLDSAGPPVSSRANDERIGRLLEHVEARGPRPEDPDQPPFNGIQSPASPGVRPRIDDFEIIREIGRGGMGIVYEAEDQRLNRRVALKLLPFNALALPKQVERFKREAQAAARLHHTNIVPVFGVGEQAGHHFYLMQYIEGFGLDAVLDQLRRIREAAPGPREAIASETVNGPIPPDHSNPPANPCPSGVTVADVARSLASGQFGERASPPVGEAPTDDSSGETAIFPPPIIPSEFVPSGPPPVILPGSGELSTQSDLKPSYFQAVARIGVQVAEALDYANRQGILHRDIKPSNLLLDIRGNVWVTDFGLAKTLGDDDLTATGDIIGTIRYMAPERFQGECDARADVYSLGLSLYELAAQHPAFEEEDRFQLIERIRHDGPSRLGMRAPKVPRDLDTIVHKAIAREPAQRYATAAALADDLRRFLDGRTILARRASLPDRSVRWCRRNPWVAASIAILLVGTIVSVWQAVRATKALGRAESEAIRATRAEAATRKEWERAETEVEINKAVNEFLNKDMLAQASAYIQASLNWKPDPELKVRTALERAAEKIGERFADRPLVEAAIRRTIGDTYQQLGLLQEAQPHLERALELRRSVLGAEDPETLNAMVSLGALFLANGKTAEAGRLLVPAMEGLRRTRGEGHPDTLTAMNAVGAVYVDQDKLAEAEALLSRTIDGFRAVWGAEHVETLQTMNNLANVYLTEKKPAQAERLLDQAIKSLQEKVGGEHPASLIAMNNLAIAYSATGKRQEAEALWKDVVRIQRRVLGDNHPDTLTTMVSLGEFYLYQHRYDEAEPLLLEALKGCREALDRNHLATDAAVALLSVLYVNKGELKKAEPYLIEAMEITRARYGPDHAMTAWATQLVGAILVNQKEYARAEPYLRDSLASRVKTEPEGSERFVSESWLGICLLGLKRYAEAETLLLSAYEGINARKDDRAPGGRNSPLNLLDRIVDLYDAWGKKDQAEEWRTKRADLDFPADPFAP
jgi:serine/threonine protein kinase